MNREPAKKGEMQVRKSHWTLGIQGFPRVGQLSDIRIPVRNEWTYMYRGFLNWGYPVPPACYPKKPHLPEIHQKLLWKIVHLQIITSNLDPRINPPRTSQKSARFLTLHCWASLGSQ